MTTSPDASVAEADVDTTGADGTVEEAPRRTYDLEDTGFREVPKRWRKFYRVWQGDGDTLAPNEVICPVCKVVIRSRREYRAGDRVYCMCCFTRMILVETPDGGIEPEVIYQ